MMSGGTVVGPESGPAVALFIYLQMQEQDLGKRNVESPL
jgi:hypothetical protein